MSGKHDGDRTEDGLLGEEARRALELVPLWALELTRGARGLDAREARALARVVQESFLYRREFVRALLAPLTGQTELLLERFRADPRSPAQGVQAAGDALRQVPEEDAGAFRTVLLAGVWRVAAAAGRQDPQQRARLGVIARYLERGS